MPSPVEKFYESIFGHLPTRDGEAYERLAAIALHILNSGAVRHDTRMRGDFSKTMYQIDALQVAKGKTTMAEVKDYSSRDAKVGRGDLQKLGGALPDIQKLIQVHSSLPRATQNRQECTLRLLWTQS